MLIWHIYDNGTRSMTDGVLLMKMMTKRRRSVQVIEIVHKQRERERERDVIKHFEFDLKRFVLLENTNHKQYELFGLKWKYCNEIQIQL